MYLDIFQTQIKFSKTTELVNDWKGTDLGDRLKNFYDSGGFAKVLNDYSKVQPTLIHGDLCLENILFDPDTLQVTALLDFDFSHIASPGEEFFYSFPDFHGVIPGPFAGPEMESLRLAQLSGFKDKNKDQVESPVFDWKTARMWQAAMEKAGANSPPDIDKIGELATIYWFLLDICPPYFLMPRWLKKATDERKQASKKQTETHLDKYLKRWGY